VIVRRFRARASAENAKAYYAFFHDTLTPELRKIEGHRGALIFSRPTKHGDVRITVLTFWESMDAITRFAGEKPTRSVLEPEARALLSDFDDEVTHHTVEVDTR
jgi:heme-degrading monooxygenase HmoA